MFHISKQGTILKCISLNLHFTTLYAYKPSRKIHKLKIKNPKIYKAYFLIQLNADSLSPFAADFILIRWPKVN